MKFSANDKTEPWIKGRHRFRLSFYITLTIIFLVVVSTVTVSGVLYFNLEKSLSREFTERIEAESREASQVLAYRMHLIRTRLNTLSHDNTIRVTLMLGADHRLEEHLETVYSTDAEFNFFIGRLGEGPVFSTISRQFSPEQIRSALAQPPATIIFGRDTDRPGFTLTYSLPIFRQKDRIGTASILYLFAQDSYIGNVLDASGERGFVIVEEGTAWNLLTGKRLGTIHQRRSDRSAPGIIEVEINGVPTLLMQKSELKNLYFMESLQPLKQARQRVLMSVLLPTLVVIVLALLVSSLLSRKLVRPLRRLTAMAEEITAGFTGEVKELPPSRIQEFNHLSASLRTMINHLHRSREMERYQVLFEGVADMVFIHDLEGKILSINDVAKNRLGTGGDYQELYHMGDLIPVNRQQNLENELAKLRGAEKRIVFSTELLGPHNTSIWVEFHAHRITFRERPMILSVARDITDRLEAERAMERSHSTLLTVLDSIEAIIHVSELSTHRILFLNRYAREVFGEPTEASTCYSFFAHKDSPCRHCAKLRFQENDIPLTESFTWEGQNCLNKRWYLNNDRLIRWIDGKNVHFQFALDITGTRELMQKKEQAEAELRKAQKMEAIAALAGGVAHDLNNILSGIVSYPDILLTQIPEDSDLGPPLRAIKDTGIKAAATVQDLLTLARRGVVTSEVISINEIVENYLKSPEHERLLKEHRNIRVETELAPNLLNILGSPIHLCKTLMNLVVNGAEAIEGEGCITISSSAENIIEAEMTNPKARDGEYVLLQVADNGCGISKEDRERIFEPFFTTKVMGRSGTGLGMAVVWGTVEDHEGFIEIDSTAGKGTVFKLYFPATRQKLIREQVAYSREDLMGSGQTILVIDDVPEQRKVASMIFSQLNYQVETVSSGEEGVEYLSDHSVDLILLDMIMEGGMDGLETYKQIIKIHPGQKAIIASGYSRSSLVQEALKLGAGQYVKKPYLYDEIALAVKKELSG